MQTKDRSDILLSWYIVLNKKGLQNTKYINKIFSTTGRYDNYTNVYFYKRFPKYTKKKLSE